MGFLGHMFCCLASFAKSFPMSSESREEGWVPLKVSFPPPGIDRMLKFGNTSLFACESAIKKCFVLDVLKMCAFLTYSNLSLKISNWRYSTQDQCHLT